MIVDPGYKTNDIVAIRISGGDEVIAKFIEQDPNTITVSKPLALELNARPLLAAVVKSKLL